MSVSPEVISAELKIYKITGFSGESHPSLRKKLVTEDKLPGLRDFYKDRGLLTAFTTGTYDMIHIGHGRYLELAKSLGDVLIVGLNSDISVKGYKGPDRPILGQDKRAEMLAFLNSVDYITLYDAPTAEGVIKILQPNRYLCVEGSWPEGTELKDKEEVRAVSEYGGDIFLTPRQEPHLSTSAIVDRLEAAGTYNALQKLQELMSSEFSTELAKNGAL